MRRSIPHTTSAQQGFYYGFFARSFFAGYFCCNSIKPSEKK